jgi:hypothetical protein
MYSSVSGSFNDLVMKLREKLDARFPNDHKLIIAYYYNNAVNFTSTAVANMNQTYNAITLNQIKNRSAQSKNDGMGAIAGYDMRVHTERDPLPALQKIGEGAFNGTVTRSGSAYTKDWTAGPER